MYKALYVANKSISINYESFVNDIDVQLLRILTFLKLPAYKGFITDCKSILNHSVMNESDEIDWTSEQIDTINSTCSNVPYLTRYLR